MNIKMDGVKVKILSHKYALEIKHEELDVPFKVVVAEAIQQGSGASLGWVATPEIQLRQTTMGKQEYIMSNCNPTLEEAVQECLVKMGISRGKDVFYAHDFEQNDNRLW
ncbi:MAG: hypothetical protein A3G87_01450 [Omnitrophica bacterium RIFCSPLOWO2_12_FULL_50_11]|nr:MAG: hypothetical protein A3G87_01450 [Omnitrophica bacterium RIFCSPLOWO2_12_FULL_50_11]